ncbi:glycosyltransferase [Lachnospiraceae bacterium ZAX-1]
MNNKQIALIIHIVNSELAAAALEAVNNLVIPSGYTLDVITVEQSGSTTEAYQAAMQESDAKYKIYLHENTMIVNKNLLTDLLAVFSTDASVGMVGLVGAQMLPPSTIVCHGLLENAGVFGKKQIITDKNITESRFSSQADAVNVEVVEDFFIATAVDLPWNTDAYECSYHAGIEYAFAVRGAGYKILIPFQETAWCAVADIKNQRELERFEHEKAVFLKRNRTYFPLVGVGIPTYNRPELIRESIDSVLSQTYPNLKIFIEDNSDDNQTEKMLKLHYLCNYDNISYERNLQAMKIEDYYDRSHDNVGRTVERIDTEYCVMLCDDDMLSPQSIERQMNYFCVDSMKKISITSGFFCLGDEKMNPLGILFHADEVFYEDYFASGDFFANLMLKYGITLFSGLGNIFRKERLIERFATLGGYRGRFNGDRFAGYVLLSTGCAVFVKEILVYYRFHPQSATQSEYSSSSMCNGTNDCFYEIQIAGKYGFLKDKNDYIAALENLVCEYDTYVFTDEYLSRIEEKDMGLIDTAIRNVCEAYKLLETLKQM